MTRGEAVNWLINITADISKSEHRDLWHYEQALSEIREMLESEPERKKGKWMTMLYHISDDGEELYQHVCSECKKTVMLSNLKRGRFNYCPNCGAKMKGEDDEQA